MQFLKKIIKFPKKNEIQELLDTIDELNKTIAAQTQKIDQLQNLSINLANSKDVDGRVLGQKHTMQINNHDKRYKALEDKCNVWENNYLVLAGKNADLREELKIKKLLIKNLRSDYNKVSFIEIENEKLKDDIKELKKEIERLKKTQTHLNISKQQEQKLKQQLAATVMKLDDKEREIQLLGKRLLEKKG